MNLTIFLFFFKILLKTMAISVQFVALYNYFCCNWPLHTHTHKTYIIYMFRSLHILKPFLFSSFLLFFLFFVLFSCLSFLFQDSQRTTSLKKKYFIQSLLNCLSCFSLFPLPFLLPSSFHPIKLDTTIIVFIE